MRRCLKKMPLQPVLETRRFPRPSPRALSPPASAASCRACPARADGPARSGGFIGGPDGRAAARTASPPRQACLRTRQRRQMRRTAASKMIVRQAETVCPGSARPRPGQALCTRDRAMLKAAPGGSRRRCEPPRLIEARRRTECRTRYAGHLASRRWPRSRAAAAAGRRHCGNAAGQSSA